MEEVSVSFFLIGKLRDLLVDERVYLNALNDVVDNLVEMLARLNDLIEHSYVRRDERITDIIKMADLMIDSVEMYVFRVVKNHNFRAFLLRSKLCLAIENLTITIREFVSSQSRAGSSGVSSESNTPYKVQDLSYFIEKDFIGREDDVNKLVSYLVDHQEEKYRVISIYGMGGLGKTTLARKVYKEKKVLEHFRRFAFVCVSQRSQAKEILKHILQQLLKKEEEMKDMSEGEVTVSLQRMIREEKCLVVVDDLWSVNDWERLSHDLLGGSRSRILLTTRNKDVAEKGFFYPLKGLCKDKCWELLRNRLFKFQDADEVSMEKLGREMVSWCKGNPLAIIVLRGVLVTKGSLPEWLRFYHTRKREGDSEYKKFKDGVSDDLVYSYNELPYPLRPCFLCMASFAEDKEIDVDRLIMLWNAEGMILSKDKKEGETMMDVGARYLEELVGRCMIEAELDDDEVKPNVGRRRYKLCRVHDLMRELCLSLVEKEFFLKVHDYRGSDDTTLKRPTPFSVNDTLVPPRQVLYFSSRNHEFIVEDHKQIGTRYVRSLMFNGGHGKKCSNLKKMALVRVLSLYNMKIENTKIIYELIHLRYLSLNSCELEYVQSPKFNYLFLQTLDMRAYSIETIPTDALKELKRLQHLFLPTHFLSEVIQKIFKMKSEGLTQLEMPIKVTQKYPKLRLEGLTKLETLVNVDSSRCEMKDVSQLTSLIRLEIRLRISSKDDGQDMKELISKVNWNQLKHLLFAVELNDPKIGIYSDVLKAQLPSDFAKILQDLQVVGMRPGMLLPEFCNYSHLDKLYLGEFEVDEDPFPILEKLSNLADLRLNKGKLLKGKEMTCSANGFPKLKELHFSFMENWEKWWIEQGAMPNLRFLLLVECSDLGKLPDGLKFVKSLENVSTLFMPEEFEMWWTRDGSVGGETSN